MRSSLLLVVSSLSRQSSPICRLQLLLPPICICARRRRRRRRRRRESYSIHLDHCLSLPSLWSNASLFYLIDRWPWSILIQIQNQLGKYSVKIPNVDQNADPWPARVTRTLRALSPKPSHAVINVSIMRQDLRGAAQRSGRRS
jgi:hypothetical protein